VIHVVRKARGESTGDGKASPQLQDALQKPAFFETQETKAPLEATHVSFEQIEADSIVKAIVERTKHTDLAILGSSQQGWLHRKIFGEIGHQVARLASCPVALLNQETHPVQFSIQSFFQFFHELDETPSQESKSN
jgi:nucleotide-binding universal stress UspA family protein